MNEADVTVTGITPEMGAESARLQQKHFEELTQHFGSKQGAMAQFVAYGVDGGKALGVSKEHFLLLVSRLWDAAEVAADMVKTGRASGPEGYARLQKALKGEHVLEAVQSQSAGESEYTDDDVRDIIGNPDWKPES